MGFNGPGLSLAWRKSREVTQDSGGGAGGLGDLSTGHNLEPFLLVPFFPEGTSGNCDLIQLLKFILAPGAFPTSSALPGLMHILYNLHRVFSH